MIGFDYIKKFFSKKEYKCKTNNALDEIDSLILRIREKREELGRKRGAEIDGELNNNH